MSPASPQSPVPPEPTGPVLSYAGAMDVTAATYSDELAAQLAIGALRERAIDARLRRGRGAFDVRVPSGEEGEARRILADVRQRAARVAASRRCPACGVEGVEAASPVRRSFGGLLIVAGLLAMAAWPALGVVMIAVGIGAFSFAVRGEVLRCPRCRRTIHPHRDPGIPAGGSDV